MLISAVERSGDTKLSDCKNVSATWVPQHSCHEDCPLKRNGCYAEVGNSGIHTHTNNGKANRYKTGLAKLRLILAKQEAKAIRGLTGKRKLRVHVVGDCATAQAAAIVGKAMIDHEKKQGKVAWTYTHSWRRILPKHWRGARVMASCETPEQVRQANARGYAAALIIPPIDSNKQFDYHGLTVVPCPAQFKREDGTRHATCEHCTLCQQPDMLLTRGLTIGFQPDGQSTKRILRILNNGGQRA
jgi:hypothetical protein